MFSSACATTNVPRLTVTAKIKYKFKINVLDFLDNTGEQYVVRVMKTPIKMAVYLCT